MNQAYTRWLTYCQERALHLELQEMANDPQRINDCFYSELKFGTGGLRGVMGAGSNRMNTYTVGKATKGYADYLKQQSQQPSVAIAYDTRGNSALFARHAACILAQNGVQVHLFMEPTPTPLLSYAVRQLKVSGGIVITASHNPAEYNGYKVYGADGCQITDDVAHAVERCIAKVDIFTDVLPMDYDRAVADAIICPMSESIFEGYIDDVAALAPKDSDAVLSIVYSPLHGTGLRAVLAALTKAGFDDVAVVAEQALPDPAFTTCPFPNPEIPEALTLGLRDLKASRADLLLATDPDCDRVGIAVWDGDAPRLITGNEVGVLLLDYLCKTRQLPPHPVAIKTIVTTDMALPIAEHYGVELRDVLTGFKYIGEQIGLLEKQGRMEDYILGFEESYGYLTGTHARDKDGVNAVLLICRMTAWYKERNMTLADALRQLSARFGVYAVATENHLLPGENGMHQTAFVMNSLRTQPPRTLAGLKLRSMNDYQKQVQINFEKDTQDAIPLPPANVIKLYYEQGITVVMRPSGTEPKLRLYFFVRGEDAQQSEIQLGKVQAAFTQVLYPLLALPRHAD